MRCRFAAVVVGLVVGLACGCSSSGNKPAADASTPPPTTPAVSPVATQLPADGGTYGDAEQIERALAYGGAPCGSVQAQDPTQLDNAIASDECASPNTASLDVDIVVFKAHSDVMSLVSAHFQFDDGRVMLSGVNWSLEAPPAYAQQAEGILGGVLYTQDPSPSPTVAATPAPEQVTYACTGHGGVNITYGPNGSQHSASSLPFSHTDPLTQGALYYVTSAQLQGGGSVSCTTTVQIDDLGGFADQTSNSASADGGYNIASAQVCSDPTGGWTKC